MPFKLFKQTQLAVCSVLSLARMQQTEMEKDILYLEVGGTSERATNRD